MSKMLDHLSLGVSDLARARVFYDAVLGALVIAIIPNGLQLNATLGAQPQWQSVITGVVLLLAAAIDAISRRRATRS